MIIYNLKKYLAIEFPGEEIYVGSKRGLIIQDRIIQLINTGGTSGAWYNYITESIQIITRDIDSPRSYKMALDIYNKLHSHFGLILPENIVGLQLYPEIQIAQISANSTPAYIGDDEGGRSEFSTNYRIIY